MSTNAFPGYRDALARHVEERLEVIPHQRERSQGLLLDDHQKDAMLETAVALQDEHRYRAFSIVHSCGSGKTVLEANMTGASQDAKHDLGINGDRRDIILTTERALINVIRRQFETLGFDDLGVWGNGEKILDRPVILSTIQAMQHNTRDLARLLPLDRIDLIIGDEADSFLTPARQDVIERLDGTLRVGFTATPRWRDGRDISDVWGPKVHELYLREGIRRGINVPPTWFLYDSNLDAETISIRHEDYERKTLAAALKHAEIHRAIPEIYGTVLAREQRPQFPTLVYVPSTYLVDQVVGTLSERFGSEGVTVRGWKGDSVTPHQLNDDIDNFRNGNLNILVLCEMGGRGLDIPAARFLIDAYPTLSPTKLEQRHGRVLRRVRPGSPLYESGFRKDYAIVVQVLPRANAFRPVCLPDILDGWEDAAEGKAMTSGGEGGASWLEEVKALKERIEAQRPTINVSLVRQLDVYRHVARFDDLPQADESGFIYLPRNHGEQPGT
jgi:superfamily II DNA or RNA helicase